MEDSDKIDQTIITGSKGKISFSFFEPKPIEVITRDKSETIKIDYPKHVQQPLIQTLVYDLMGTGKCKSTGESAARTNLVMEYILRK